MIHVSESEAATNFASLLERVRAGDEVVIEHDARPVAVLRPPAAGQPIEDIFAGIAATVPDEDWARLPADLARNLDHYLYGSSKLTR